MKKLVGDLLSFAYLRNGCDNDLAEAHISGICELNIRKVDYKRGATQGHGYGFAAVEPVDVFNDASRCLAAINSISMPN
jgi:hypothetical protein